MHTLVQIKSILSPVETGTVTSIWQHLVTCWDWYCHIHMATSCHLLRLVLSHPYGKILSPVEIGIVTSIWQNLVTCWDWYHHVHIAISCHHLFRLIPSCSQCKLNAQQSPTMYLQLCYKALLTYGVRIKCLVWSAAYWNLSEKCIRKYSLTVICTGHLAFSGAHCVSGVTNLMCQNFNFDISDSLKW